MTWPSHVNHADFIYCCTVAEVHNERQSRCACCHEVCRLQNLSETGCAAIICLPPCRIILWAGLRSCALSSSFRQQLMWLLNATLVRPDFLCGKAVHCSSKRKGSNCPVQVDPCSESSISVKQPEFDWRLCCVHQYDFGVSKTVDRSV